MIARKSMILPRSCPHIKLELIPEGDLVEAQENMVYLLSKLSLGPVMLFIVIYPMNDISTWKIY